MKFDSLVTKLIEDSTSKAPKGDSYDSQNNWKPSGVDAKSDGAGGRYRRTRPNMPGRSNRTHGENAEDVDESNDDVIDITLPKDLADVLHELLMAVTTAEETDDHEELKKNPEEDAEYQGRKVTLNKPTRGDVKKFKVYVKDPKTGNVKKVNFGHGGTSAKRKGEKTMKIRKSNPKARKSFRARHNCDNPGPKTKARYWSCRKW